MMNIGGEKINIEEISIVIGGILSLLMVFFHMGFHRIFHWEKGLKSVREMNIRIVYSIHIALILAFLIFTALSFGYTEEMAQCEGLAFGLVGSIAVFWFWRTIWQLIYFRPPRNHKKLLLMHWALVVIFLLLSSCYSIPVVMKFI